MPQDADKTGREIHAIPDQQYRSPVPVEARGASAPQQPMLRAPNGAPNGVIVLIDDMGLRHPERLWRLCGHAHQGSFGESRAALPAHGTI
jgi:hypothetical protein